jgi:hypothetical protein
MQCTLVRLALHPDAQDVPLLRRAAAATRTRLYVLLRGDWRPVTPAQAQERLSLVYGSLAQSHPRLDVRVLLPPAETASSSAAVEPGAAVVPPPGSGASTLDAGAVLAVAPGAPELQALLGATVGDGDDLAQINAGRAAAGLGPLTFYLLPPVFTDIGECHVSEEKAEPKRRRVDGGGVGSPAVFAAGYPAGAVQRRMGEWGSVNLEGTGDVPGRQGESEGGQDVQRRNGQWESVCVEGAFDRLHAGHKHLLSMGALACRRRCVYV